MVFDDVIRAYCVSRTGHTTKSVAEISRCSVLEAASDRYMQGVRTTVWQKVLLFQMLRCVYRRFEEA
jgi:hypothetical protein